ncbi:MAG: hypothetical protein ACR2NZ_12725 [Rubripirellula sp.]
MNFELCIGIDYSGAKTPLSRSSALQVYESRRGEEPQPVLSPSSTDRLRRNWCRREIATWLADKLRKDERIIAGIDHGFSFPISYFKRHELSCWDQFLIDFTEHWPTDRDDVYVNAFREHNDGIASKRSGSNKEFRLTEKWSSSAKSVFQFDVQGSVAKSTHAGIPWLLRIRNDFGDHVHFWPFDGWIPPEGKSVIAEIYPSIFRNRFPRQQRSCDQQDAYSVARWLSETSQAGFLGRYFNPPLTDHERETADLEGWILGIT